MKHGNISVNLVKQFSGRYFINGFILEDLLMKKYPEHFMFTNHHLKMKIATCALKSFFCIKNIQDMGCIGSMKYNRK